MRSIYLIAPAVAYAIETIQPLWTGPFGPDGPWHAVTIGYGDANGNLSSAAWPRYDSQSWALTPAAGGQYVGEANWSDVVSWLSTNSTMNGQSHGDVGYDGVVLKLPGVMYGVDTVSVNTTVYAMDKWAYQLPDGSNYSAKVGTLGLGRTIAGDESPGFLQTLQSQGTLPSQGWNRIASKSFGLHMGSVALGQPPSLVFGGYEQNRALGPVGVFQLRDTFGTTPLLYLLDVLLGTQLGASPFEKPEYAGSVWQGVDASAEADAMDWGAKPGTALVVPNPTVPYIYLPNGTCEAAARRLPVTWNDRLGLYTWNTGDPAYHRIVRSPAYLAFVLADRTATNITIKVPFVCLTSHWSRHSLQPQHLTSHAAFLGFDYEQNVTYLAQARGPAAVQSVVQVLRPGDAAPKTDPIEEFEKSWLPSWTVLQDDSPSGSSSASGEQPSSYGNRSLSPGSLVGIVLGTVAALAAAAAAVRFFFWRHKPKATKSLASGTQSSEEQVVSHRNQPGDLDMDGQGVMAELGKPNAHEMPCPREVHEIAADSPLDHQDQAPPH